MPAPRFSLRAFLLVLIMGTLIGSHLLTSWQLWHSNQENAEMRKEVGRLTIDDKDKVHVISVPTQEDMLWRWRVYLPKDLGRHELCVSTHAIPQNGFPKSLGKVSLLPQEGEQLLTAAIRPNRSGEPQLTITWGKAISSIGIADEDAHWLAAQQHGFSSSLAGANGTEGFDPDQPIVLLRLNVMQPDPAGGYSISSDAPPGNGVMIWINP